MKLAENSKLKELIFERLKEIDMSPAELIKDASERKMKITASSFSKYKLGKKGALTDTQILWVATRLNIPIHLSFGTPHREGDKIKYKLTKYSEIAALTNLKKVFPDVKEGN